MNKMPKIIELTVELDVERVSCPGVWLCQDGRVSLTVLALGTSYQTCMLPPIFPIEFRDVFYFRKRFEETCSLNNIVCLLKDETIYCELVQWCEDCSRRECTILAQYLGAMNDVLFPPQMCSSDGIDLLMRRSKEFPGILSPKIEIKTKVRIDEVWNNCSNEPPPRSAKIRACSCAKPEFDPTRQKQVCHTSLYHRIKCNKRASDRSRPPSRSRSRSRSCCSFMPKEPLDPVLEPCGLLRKPTAVNACSPYRTKMPTQQYQVYRSEAPPIESMWRGMTYLDTSSVDNSDYDCYLRHTVSDKYINAFERTMDDDKVTLESRFVDYDQMNGTKSKTSKQHCQYYKSRGPCVCEICKRYHELFHSGKYQI